MRPPALLVSSALAYLRLATAIAGFLALFASASCATYRSDLERARAHYDKNEYEPALALFRVLEHDVDSFSAAEYAQYSYSRGMTDYRLSALASAGNAAVDPKQAFRSHARHWLAVARAIEKETPGGLTADEKQRVEEALADLNRDVYGGGDTAGEGDAKPDGGAPPSGAPSKDKDKAAKPDK
jgi:hypothetical protein